MSVDAALVVGARRHTQTLHNQATHSNLLQLAEAGSSNAFRSGATVSRPERRLDNDEAGVVERLAAARSMFGRSLHIRTIDTGSCAVCESEIRLLLAPHYDLHRLGIFFTPAPRHADLLMVTGPAVRAMDIALAKTYRAMPEPKGVIAVGACPLGGVYSEDELVHGELSKLIPVDVFIPGCPPSPLALIHGLLLAIGRLAEKVGDIPFYQDIDVAFPGVYIAGRADGPTSFAPSSRKDVDR